MLKDILTRYEEDKIMSGDAIWYRLLKQLTNKLAFDILLSQNKLEDAFNYFETVGVNYIIPRKEQQYESEEYFEVSKHGFPYNADESKWLGPDELHGATLDCYYSDIWAKVLKYLTKINFYENFIINSPNSQFISEVENQIIKITEDYLCDQELKREILNWKIPKIVGTIFEKRKDWNKAIKYYEISNISEKEKNEFIYYCKFQRGDNIYRLLLDEVKHLTLREQKQILAFTKLIILLEPKLREFVRKTIEKHGQNVNFIVSNILGTKEIEKRKNRYEDELSLPSEPYKDELDWLTFPELLSLIINDNCWNYFNPIFKKKSGIISIISEITPIRNNIAHAMPLTEVQLNYTLEKTNRILKIIHNT